MFLSGNFSCLGDDLTAYGALRAFGVTYAHAGSGLCFNINYRCMLGRLDVFGSNRYFSADGALFAFCLTYSCAGGFNSGNYNFVVSGLFENLNDFFLAADCADLINLAFCHAGGFNGYLFAEGVSGSGDNYGFNFPHSAVFALAADGSTVLGAGGFNAVNNYKFVVESLDYSGFNLVAVNAASYLFTGNAAGSGLCCYPFGVAVVELVYRVAALGFAADSALVGYCFTLRCAGGSDIFGFNLPSVVEHSDLFGSFDNFAADIALCAFGVAGLRAGGFNRGNGNGGVGELRNNFFNMTLAASCAAADFKTFFGAGGFFCYGEILEIVSECVNELNIAVAASCAVAAGGITLFGAGRLFCRNGHIIVSECGNGLYLGADSAAYLTYLAFGGTGCGAGSSYGGSDIPVMTLSGYGFGRIDYSLAE